MAKSYASTEPFILFNRYQVPLSTKGHVKIEAKNHWLEERNFNITKSFSHIIKVFEDFRFVQELREESPEKKSRFKVMQAMDSVQKEEAKENPSKNRFQVQPASQPDEVIENKSDEKKEKSELVVEKQDMEKLETME